MKILITGGMGYIGSHTVVNLVNNNHDVYIVDNLVNSSIEVLNKIKKLCKFPENIHFKNLCLLDKEELIKYINLINCESCIHFASLKSVSESVTKPLLYYNNNIIGLLNLLEGLENIKCNKLIFSSSSTVYGNIEPPFNETHETGHRLTNPYGKTKYMIEEILKDYCYANKNFNVISLRYFNPVGAHPSGEIGESPNGIPNNLMPFILKVLNNKLDKLTIYGDDYDTPDGTCIRDYIHVMDLADAHTISLSYFENGFNVYNLGCGKGYSVKEVINMIENVSKKKVNHTIGNRREGDIPISYGNVDKIFTKMGWKSKYNLKSMCEDSWNFIKNQN
jgi:UDP-glucose 4-epimerase